MNSTISIIVAATLALGGLACGDKKAADKEPEACVQLMALVDAQGKFKQETPERIQAHKSKLKLKMEAAGVSMETACKAALDEVRAKFADLRAEANDPMGKALDHQEAMLKLLEENKDDPAKAGAALEKYHADNKADFDAIKKQGEKMEAKMKDNPEAAMKMFAKYADRLKTITERARKLTDAHPDLMMNEGVQKAMAGLR